MKEEPSAAWYVASFWARQVALGEAALEVEELVDVVVLNDC